VVGGQVLTRPSNSLTAKKQRQQHHSVSKRALPPTTLHVPMIIGVITHHFDSADLPAFMARSTCVVVQCGAPALTCGADINVNTRHCLRCHADKLVSAIKDIASTYESPKRSRQAIILRLAAYPHVRKQ
jgi:hypothetical protein